VQILGKHRINDTYGLIYSRSAATALPTQLCNLDYLSNALLELSSKTVVRRRNIGPGAKSLSMR